MKKKTSKRRRQYKSTLEKRISKELQELRGKFKFLVDYETENLEYIKNYLPDFILSFKDGRKMYIETKGYLSADDRSKMIQVKKSHPEKDIRFLFDRDNKLSRNSKMKYSDWSIKNGFPFAIHKVPLEWLVE